MLHGVTVHPAPWDMSALDAFAGRTRRVDILNYFIRFEGNDHAPERDRLAELQARGITPMITWEWHHLTSFSDVYLCADGIRLWARELKAHGGPVLLRWGHEMNLPNYPWGSGCGTPDEYNAAFRWIRTVFNEEQTDNVLFVWCPNILGGPAVDFWDYYPGDEYVDWLGLDGYNWASNPWCSFTTLFNESYRRITALSRKPLMIAEWGCTSACDEGAKSTWLERAVDEAALMPQVKALVYFNNEADGEFWPLKDGEIEGYARAWSRR
jgi:hypothetical protein